MINLAAAVGCAQLENLRKILVAKEKFLNLMLIFLKTPKTLKL